MVEEPENWKRPVDELPPENEIVYAMDSTGRVTKLKRRGRLWWMADGKMYVYYTPTFWKPLPAPPAAHPE